MSPLGLSGLAITVPADVFASKSCNPSTGILLTQTLNTFISYHALHSSVGAQMTSSTMAAEISWHFEIFHFI